MRHEAHYAYSTWDKSVRMLGFEHKTSLEDGLKQMWSWAQHQPNRKRFVWQNYEIDKGIYSYWKNEEDSNSTSI
jgi:UDP-glucose 4-epimerase